MDLKRELTYLCSQASSSKVEVLGRSLMEFVPWLRYRDVVLPDFEGVVRDKQGLLRVATSILDGILYGAPKLGTAFLELAALQREGDENWTLEMRSAPLENVLEGQKAVLHCVVVWMLNGRTVYGSSYAFCNGVLRGDPSLCSTTTTGLDLPWSHIFEPDHAQQTLAQCSASAFVCHPRTEALLEFGHHLRALWDIDYRGIFESHVTVSGGPGAAPFKVICEELGVKTILIELNNPPTAASRDVELRPQLMTAAHHTGQSLYEVQLQAYGIARRFLKHGFVVERVKVEAMFSSEGVPDTDSDSLHKFSPQNYFEFHIKVQLPLNNGEGYTALHTLLAHHKGHLSRNALNLVDGEYEHRFVTLRLYRVGRITAGALFEKCVADLVANNYQLVSKMREYSVYDSNVLLDHGWIDKSR